MKRKYSTYFFVILLLLVSGLFYWIQQILFNRPKETAFYFLQDLAFVPISVLLVTVGLNTVIARRERQAMIEKVSIVVNEFFAELGTDLIRSMQKSLVDLDKIAISMQPSGLWQDKDFTAAALLVNREPLLVDARKCNLPQLCHLLEQKKDQILRLFENANLLEHDRFTDMLWAVYHVYDELRSRESLENLPESDLQHISSDIQRASRLLLIEWLDYMRNLKHRYPYLYSLAVRKCPFGNHEIVIKSV